MNIWTVAQATDPVDRDITAPRWTHNSVFCMSTDLIGFLVLLLDFGQ